MQTIAAGGRPLSHLPSLPSSLPPASLLRTLPEAAPKPQSTAAGLLAGRDAPCPAAGAKLVPPQTQTPARDFLEGSPPTIDDRRVRNPKQQMWKAEGEKASWGGGEAARASRPLPVLASWHRGCLSLCSRRFLSGGAMSREQNYCRVPWLVGFPGRRSRALLGRQQDAPAVPSSVPPGPRAAGTGSPLGFGAAAACQDPEPDEPSANSTASLEGTTGGLTFPLLRGSCGQAFLGARPGRRTHSFSRLQFGRSGKKTRGVGGWEGKGTKVRELRTVESTRPARRNVLAPDRAADRLPLTLMRTWASPHFWAFTRS